MTTEREADAALENALELCAAAYDWPGVRSGYLLFAEHEILNDDDTTANMMAYHTPPRQKWTSTLGILRAGTLRLENDYVTHD